MTHLAARRACPRKLPHRPRYPSLATIGIVSVVSACGVAACGGSPEPPARTPAAAVVEAVPIVVPASPPSDHVMEAADVEESGWTAEELIAAAPPRFPEDDAPEPLIGCGGGCPPAYQLSAQAKDRSQILARVRYCADGVREHWPDLKGDLDVKADIDEQGVARSALAVVPDGAPAPLKTCVEALVSTAEFDADPPFARTTRVRTSLEVEEVGEIKS